MEQPSPVKCESSGPDFTKLIQWLTFFMVCSMTVAQKPIQSLMERIDHKAQHEAQLAVCNQIYGKKEVYATWTTGAFLSGCMWNARNVLISMTKSKKEEDKVDQMFKGQDSEKFDKIKDYCESGRADYQREGKIEDSLFKDLAVSFNCVEVWKEEEKNEKSK